LENARITLLSNRLRGPDSDIRPVKSTALFAAIETQDQHRIHRTKVLASLRSGATAILRFEHLR